jgi:hypothetical protein
MKLYVCLLVLGLSALALVPSAIAPTAAARAEEAAATAAAPTVTSVDARGVFRVNGRPFFPIGVTMPPPLQGTTPWGTGGLDELVAGGVTVFRTGPSARDWDDQLLAYARAWNDAAAARGVYTWVHLRELAEATPGSAAESTLEHVVETLKSSPGLGFWKGADEPWPRLLPPELSHAYDVVKAADPDHVFHTVFGPFSEGGSMYHRAPNPPNLRPYNRVTDTHGMNVYPIYHLLQGAREPKLHMVGRWLAALRGATGRNALTMTVQICFKGSKNRQGDDFILPTRRQERYMVYDAIVNGARGLFFFGGELPRCHSARDHALGWNWTFWGRVLEDLLGEVNEGSPLHPALLRPETTVRLRTGNGAVEAISRRAGNDYWVIAANNGKSSVKAVIRGLPAWAKVGRLYPGTLRVNAKNGSVTQHFPGWGVRVLRFTRS